MATIFIISSNKAFIDFAHRVLEAKHFKIVGEANTCAAGIKKIQESSPPNIILLDFKSFDVDEVIVIVLLGLYSFAKTKIIVFHLDIHDIFPSRVLTRNAAGYLGMHFKAEELIKTIQAVMDDQRIISPEIINYLEAINAHHQKDEILKTFSDTELKVLLLLTSGRSITDTAHYLQITHKTALVYRNRILQKLALKNYPSLFWTAIKKGWITIDKKGWRHTLGVRSLA